MKDTLERPRTAPGPMGYLREDNAHALPDPRVSDYRYLPSRDFLFGRTPFLHHRAPPKPCAACPIAPSSLPLPMHLLPSMDDNSIEGHSAHDAGPSAYPARYEDGLIPGNGQARRLVFVEEGRRRAGSYRILYARALLSPASRCAVRVGEAGAWLLKIFRLAHPRKRTRARRSTPRPIACVPRLRTRSSRRCLRSRRTPHPLHTHIPPPGVPSLPFQPPH
ncbi:hypothetical protein DFH07DRAFT_120764 [Mycena maculata]|uniref:Uncharacterized protein n=1 Tax=Mycena maculata TaxID=230809 RepID=A0AAD7NSS0_9AGAR|nr:hypothetical protein DFH07DRAFT_120764 [Mycena maculata]